MSLDQIHQVNGFRITDSNHDDNVFVPYLALQPDLLQAQSDVFRVGLRKRIVDVEAFYSGAQVASERYYIVVAMISCIAISTHDCLTILSG